MAPPRPWPADLLELGDRLLDHVVRLVALPEVGQLQQRTAPLGQRLHGGVVVVVDGIEATEEVKTSGNNVQWG